MKKRLVALTLVAAMALGMTACGSKSNDTTKTNTNDTQSAAEQTSSVDWSEYDALVDSGKIQTQKIFFHKTGFLATFPKQEWAEIVAYESRMIFDK